MRGVELPINTMVIVVLAVIILLALVAMYFSGFGPFSTAVGLEGERGDACRRLVQENGCRVATSDITTPGFDANKNNSMNTGKRIAWIPSTDCNGGATTTSDDNFLHQSM